MHGPVIPVKWQRLSEWLKNKTQLDSLQETHFRYESKLIAEK